MKKIVFLSAILIAVGVTSCNDNEITTEEFQPKTEQTNAKRSFEEALQIAQSSISMLDEDQVGQRGVKVNRKIDLAKTKVIGKTFVRSAEPENNSGDALLYVFNFENNEGFAVVSANKATEGLIAVTEAGEYESSLQQNGGFAEYMERAKTYISGQLRSPVPFIENADTVYTHAGPYVSVKWGQYYPEGVFFPNAMAGCTNVAMLQIMSHYNYPTQIALTYDNADSTSINLEWNRMKEHSHSYLMGMNDTSLLFLNLIGLGNIPLEELNAMGLIDICPENLRNAHSDIAYLCRQIACLTRSTFNPNSANYNYNLDTYIPPYDLNTVGTGSNIYYAQEAFEQIGYTTTSPTDYSNCCTQMPLGRNRLIYMRGTDVVEGGHAWVIDGYKKYTIRGITHATEPATPFTKIIYYNHINWGWNGDSNGYFNDTLFVPLAGYEYDDPSDNTDIHYDFRNAVQYMTVYR